MWSRHGCRVFYPKKKKKTSRIESPTQQWSHTKKKNGGKKEGDGGGGWHGSYACDVGSNNLSLKGELGGGSLARGTGKKMELIWYTKTSSVLYNV